MTACSSTCTGVMAPPTPALSTLWMAITIPWRYCSICFMLSFQLEILPAHAYMLRYVFSLLHPQLHIVNMKSSLNGNVSQALADPKGLAALGFLIEVRQRTFCNANILKAP